MVEEVNFLETSDSDLTISKLKDKFGSISHDVSNANVIAIPLQNSATDSDGKVFYNRVIELNDYFNDAEQGIISDIYSDEDDFEELILHSAEYWIGSFIVSSVVIPIFVNLLSSYIYEKVNANKEDRITIDVTVDSGEGRSKTIKYKGSIEGFSKAIDKIKELE